MPRKLLPGLAVFLPAVPAAGGLLLAAPESLDDFTNRITEELRSTDPVAAALFEQASLAGDEENLAEAERLYSEVRLPM